MKQAIVLISFMVWMYCLFQVYKETGPFTCGMLFVTWLMIGHSWGRLQSIYGAITRKEIIE